MKKIIVLLLGFPFLISIPGKAQNQKPDYNAYAPKKFFTEIGIYGGPAISFLRGNPAVETNEVNKRYLKLGHTVGISATHVFSDRVGIKAFALLEKKGSIVKSENTYFDQATQTLKQGRTKEDYIYTSYSFPLMFTYSFGKEAKTQVSLGPYASYIKKQIVRTTHYPGSTGIEDQSNFNKDLEWGGAISISQRFTLTKTISLSGSILNVWGITDTRSIKNYGITKTNNTNFLFGIIFKN